MMSGKVPSGWPYASSPFHSASLEIQRRLGVEPRLDERGRRAIHSRLIEQHRDFYQQLPFVVVGALDKTGQPWATMLFGTPGFLHADTPETLTVTARPLAGDPLEAAINQGSEIGLLGIEPTTRRRNRLNGRIDATTAAGFTIRVKQAFGNCPQYIQHRAHRTVAQGPTAQGPIESVRGTRLDSSAQDLIARSDTFFIATTLREDIPGERHQGVDISHRGGRPGFVRLDDAVTLTTPDFIGNFHFRTLGNLATEPRAGLLFVDFATGDLLYLAVEAEVIWDGAEVRSFAGAERLVRFHIRTYIRLSKAMPLRFDEPEFSPFLERTGSWSQAADAARTVLDDGWRPFVITHIHQESETVRSIECVPTVGGLAPHEPGQYLPVRIWSAADGEYLSRNYTISAASNGRSYRISVKRQGRTSTLLHTARVGDPLSVKVPRGTFVYARSSHRPLVLLSCGIGITPTIAFLDALLVNEGRTLHPANIHVVHGARNSKEHAFAGYLRQKAKAHQTLHLHTWYSAPLDSDVIGVTHDGVGRIDMAMLVQLVPMHDCDFYLCGTADFMQNLYNGLLEHGIEDDRIRYESFNNISVRRDAIPDTGQSLPVQFARTGITASWHETAGSLLEIAEMNGISIQSGCRTGACGTCATRLIAGAVTYAVPPAAEADDGEIFMCCARPVAAAGPIIVDA